ncbi:MAG: polyprenyl synthetase family protein [Chitinophagales bacterium]|nr:polyprenyl synthetase family protein [Chitinophagales bacterium]MDW8428698.1 polyprenyl synthetase family protein [Chitinophagales bacterium]
MITLEALRAPIAAELRQFNQRFRDAMRSSVPLLDAITSYIVKTKGKQVRPMFVLLSARTAGNITEATYHAAALIELLHTATLVHDDVVDDASLRRGFFSINALWKNKAAVLVGDYLLARGLLLSIEHQQYQLLQLVSEAVREMSEGELLQMEKARNLSLSESDYYQIISKKTASLIAAACASGAASANAADEAVLQMKHFGYAAGMAFQMKDDLLDFTAAKSGKQAGADLREKKITLPLLIALQRASPSQRRRIKIIVHEYPNDKNALGELMQLFSGLGAIEYTQNKMEEFRKQALLHLNYFPPSPFREALAGLVDFTIHRNY